MQAYPIQTSAVGSAVADPRFWARVDQSTDCWVWQGYRDHQGYGHVMRAGLNQLTHRYAFALVNGPAVGVVRHSCDNPPCCNPRHLQDGSQADNIADRQRRGRHRPGRMLGEAHPAHKLSSDDVIEMRRLHADSGMNVADLARAYLVDYSSVYKILRRESWKHLP